MKAELKGPREEQNDARGQLNLRRGIGSLWEIIQYAQTREQSYLPSVAGSWVVRPQLGELPCRLEPFLTLPGKYSLFPSFAHLVPALRILPSLQGPGYMPPPPPVCCHHTMDCLYFIQLDGSSSNSFILCNSVTACTTTRWKKSPPTPQMDGPLPSPECLPSLGPEITVACVYPTPPCSAECLAKAWWKAVNGNLATFLPSKWVLRCPPKVSTSYSLTPVKRLPYMANSPPKVFTSYSLLLLLSHFSRVRLCATP